MASDTRVSSSSCRHGWSSPRAPLLLLEKSILSVGQKHKPKKQLWKLQSSGTRLLRVLGAWALGFPLAWAHGPWLTGPLYGDSLTPLYGMLLPYVVWDGTGARDIGNRGSPAHWMLSRAIAAQTWSFQTSDKAQQIRKCRRARPRQ